MSVRDDHEAARLAAEARARGIPEWQLQAAQAVPTSVLQDLLADARRGISQSTSLAAPDRRQSSENETHRTVAAEVPLRPPAGVALCDRMIDEQDFIDRAARLKERLEAVLLARAQAKK